MVHVKNSGPPLRRNFTDLIVLPPRAWALAVIVLNLFVSASMGGERRCDGFIHRSGTRLYCDSTPFYAVGVNSYFLQGIASYGDTAHVNEIFREAHGLGITTVRTWGFFDSPDSTDRAVIQRSPGHYNEGALKALDYVIAKAAQYSIRLIVPLVNNWDAYGGMNQYVRWYADRTSGFGQINGVLPRRVIRGVEGRSYEFVVAGMLTHDDFYRNSTIKGWYRDYVTMMLNRVNTITQRPYREEPAIAVWELANEPRSSDPSGGLVAEWADEMSAFIKSIDTDHLLSVGDEGFDVTALSYRSVGSYKEWLLDGSAGVSFRRSIGLKNVDIASLHCYPLAWGLTLNQGALWFRDHQRLSDAAQKPLIVGEVGVRNHPEVFYEVLFNEGYYRGTAGILPWQFSYDGRPNNDGFAFSYPKDTAICGVIKNYSALITDGRPAELPQPEATALFANYPNPFNPVTSLRYSLGLPSSVRLEVYNSIGQRITVLLDEDQPAGLHQSLFDGRLLSSGIYYVRLMAGKRSFTQKVCLMK